MEGWSSLKSLIQSCTLNRSLEPGLMKTQQPPGSQGPKIKLFPSSFHLLCKMKASEMSFLFFMGVRGWRSAGQPNEKLISLLRRHMGSTRRRTQHFKRVLGNFLCYNIRLFWSLSVAYNSLRADFSAKEEYKEAKLWSKLAVANAKVQHQLLLMLKYSISRTFESWSGFGIRLSPELSFSNVYWH